MTTFLLRIHAILFLGVLSGLFQGPVWAADGNDTSATASPPARIILMDQSVI